MFYRRRKDVVRERVRAVRESFELEGRRAGDAGRAETRDDDDDDDEATRGDASRKRLLRSARGVSIGGWEGIEARVQTVGS